MSDWISSVIEAGPDVAASWAYVAFFFMAGLSMVCLGISSILETVEPMIRRYREQAERRDRV